MGQSSAKTCASCARQASVTCPRLSWLPRPAAQEARWSWRQSQQEGPRANRVLITAYSASFCFVLGNGQPPKHMGSYQPAVNSSWALILT